MWAPIAHIQANRVLGQADLGGHRPGRPVRGVLGRGLQRAHDHLLDLLVGDRPRPPRPRLISQAIEAMLGEPVAPLGDLGRVTPIR